MSVFDNNALQYMLEQFPRTLLGDLWGVFETRCSDGTIISESEAKKRLESEAIETDTLDWCQNNTSLFKSLTESEAKMLGELMNSNEFANFDDSNLRERRLPQGIPFILCMAKVQNRYYVYRKNTVYLPTILSICKKHKIKRIEVEEYFLKI